MDSNIHAEQATSFSSALSTCKIISLLTLNPQNQQHSFPRALIRILDISSSSDVLWFHYSIPWLQRGQNLCRKGWVEVAVGWKKEYQARNQKLRVLFLFYNEQIWWFFLSFVCVCVFFRAAPSGYGDSQGRGLNGAIAAGLCHSHSYIRSKSHLWTTPQLMAMLDP